MHLALLRRLSFAIVDRRVNHRVDNVLGLSIPLEDAINADEVAAYEEMQQQKRLKADDVRSLASPGTVTAYPAPSIVLSDTCC